MNVIIECKFCFPLKYIPFSIPRSKHPASEMGPDRFRLFLILYTFGSIAKLYFICLYKYLFLYRTIKIYQFNTNISCSASLAVVKLNFFRWRVSLINLFSCLSNVTRPILFSLLQSSRSISLISVKSVIVVIIYSTISMLIFTIINIYVHPM